MIDVKKEVADSSDTGIYMVLYANDNYQQVFEDIMTTAVNEKKMPVIYLTIHHPYKFIINNLLRKNIPADNIYFIDCMSKKISNPEEPVKNCVFVDSPSSFTEMVIVLNQLIRKIPSDKKIIVLDSVNTLLVYQDKASVVKFLHFLINKIKIECISGIFLSMKKDTAPDFLAELTPFFDKVVDTEA